MLKQPTADVALLTAVHEEHLISGVATSLATGYVAFGTDAAMPFLELKELVDEDHPADILFYASHPTTGGPPHASYRGRFAGYDGAEKGQAKEGWQNHRPPSTKTDNDWTGFYLVQGLRKLDLPIPIASLKRRGGRSRFAKTFIPHGPIIIDTPF